MYPYHPAAVHVADGGAHYGYPNPNPALMAANRKRGHEEMSEEASSTTRDALLYGSHGHAAYVHPHAVYAGMPPAYELDAAARKKGRLSGGAGGARC